MSSKLNLLLADLDPVVIGCVVVALLAVICAVVVMIVIIERKKSRSKNSPEPEVIKTEDIKEESAGLSPASEEELQAVPVVSEVIKEAETEANVGEEEKIETVSEVIEGAENAESEKVEEAEDDIDTIAKNLEEYTAQKQEPEYQPVEEVKTEPVEEIKAEPVEEVKVKPAEAVDEDDDDGEDEQPEPFVLPRRVVPEGKILVKVRYNRSYTARIIQTADTVKNYYSEIKNELMSYGVKSRISWRHETFRSGRKLLARMMIRGKTLCLYLALDPAKYAESKYRIKDVSDIAKNAEVPTLYKIKNDRRCKYAKELIADLMAANGLEAGEKQTVDYVSQYPYEELEPLIERKLVKLLPWKQVVSDSEVGVIAVSIDDLPPEILMSEVSVDEADDMFVGSDVSALVLKSGKISDKTKKDIVNIDTLGKYFQTGETVTVEEIKNRVPGINKKATYIKVLARGKLDKALTVEADDFSPQAIKMIVLTGGKAMRTQSGT